MVAPVGDLKVLFISYFKKMILNLKHTLDSVWFFGLMITMLFPYSTYLIKTEIRIVREFVKQIPFP